MSDHGADTLQQVSTFLADALRPLLPPLARGDPTQSVKALVAELGWTLPDPVPPSLLALKPYLGTLGETAASLAELQERATEANPPSTEEILAAFGVVAAELALIIVKLADLKNRLAAELPNAYVAATHIDRDFVPRLLDLLFIEVLYRRAPRTARALRLVGIVELADQPADGAAFQPAFTLRRIRWDRLVKLFQRPGEVFAEAYGWGTPTLEMGPLLDALQSLSIAMDAHGVFDFPSNNLVRAIAPGVDPRTADVSRSYEIPLIDIGLVTVSLGVTAIPKAAPAELQGLALYVEASGGNVTLAIPLTESLSLLVEASLDASAGLALTLRPDQPPTLVSDVDGTRSPVDGGAVSVGLGFSPPGDDPGIPIFTVPGGSGLTIRGGSVRVGVEGRSGEDIDVYVEGSIEEGRVAIRGGEGDGFLAKILPGDGFEANFDLTAGVSRLDGVYFQGSGSLELQLPVHISVGPIDIPHLYIMAPLGGGGDGIPIEISSAITANLGPLQASVDRLGFKVTLAFPGSGGNLGPIDLSLGFKPPNGVGLAVDAGVVKGGGYLYFDFDKEEYAGALELVISEWIELKAIGLITTRLPDGSKGFSLLIIITAEFGTGFQLGMGFTLIGVGGLLGLNRTMRLQPLVEGVRTGAIESVMFPDDVVANAPRIISDLRNFFPPAAGIFLIGPMAKIGWSTPPLITLSLGVIIEIPGNIAILGVLKVALPNDDAPLLVLQVNFLGAIEFDKERAWFFASLFESRVLFMTLEGEMGLLIAWGRDGNFVLSVGGFHPKYNPPALPFPSPKRLSINILNESWGRIRVMCYFAVTSNSVQFGSRAELYFGLSAVSVEGHIAFDALFQFNPFFFTIEISAGVELKVFGMGMFGITLRFSLEGPSPWRAKGYGKISFWFVTIKANFDFTWGEQRATALPPIEVLPILIAELDKAASWSAVLPPANSLPVTLRHLDAAEGLVLHPVGTLAVSQRALPLDLRLDKVGTQKPSDFDRFSFSPLGGLAKVRDLEERFAIGQFLALKDSQKLSKPAFQPETAGIELAPDDRAYQTGRVAQRHVRYESVIIDTGYRRFLQPLFEFVAVLFGFFLGGNAVARAEVSHATKVKRQPFTDGVAVQEEVWVVASNRDNTAVGAGAAFRSEAKAEQHRQRLVAEDPTLAGGVHVIPQFELRDAA